MSDEAGIHAYAVRHRGPLLDETRLRETFEREFGVRNLAIGRTGDPNLRPEAGGEAAYDYEIRWHGKALDEAVLRGLLAAGFGMHAVAVTRSRALPEAEAMPGPRPWKPRLGSVADRVLAALADGEERSWGELHALLRDGPVRSWSGLALALKNLVADGRVARTGWGAYTLAASAGSAPAAVLDSGAEAKIMDALADGSLMRPSELRARTGVFPSRALERLVDKGLVDRVGEGLYRKAGVGREAEAVPPSPVPPPEPPDVREIEAAALDCLADGFTWSFAALKGRLGGSGLAVALSRLVEAGAIRKVEEGWCAIDAQGGPAAPDGLTPALRRQLGALVRPMTVREAAAAAGVGYAVAWENLQRLVDRGMVRTLSASRRNRLYAVTDESAAAAPRESPRYGFDYKTRRPISEASLHAAAVMRKRREEGRWSQRDVARSLGVSQTTVWAMENGMTEFQVGWIEAAARLFGCDADDFGSALEADREAAGSAGVADAGQPAVGTTFTLSWDDGFNELCGLWEMVELLWGRGFGAERVVEAILTARGGGTFEIEDAAAGRVAVVGTLQP